MRQTQSSYSSPTKVVLRRSSPRVNTPAPRFCKDGARFESADVYDAHVTPPQEKSPSASSTLTPPRSISADTYGLDGDDGVVQRKGGSLRHISLRRDELWILPPPSSWKKRRVVTDEKDIRNRVLSFESFHASTRFKYMAAARGDDYLVWKSSFVGVVSFITTTPIKKVDNGSVD